MSYNKDWYDSLINPPNESSPIIQSSIYLRVLICKEITATKNAETNPLWVIKLYYE